MPPRTAGAPRLIEWTGERIVPWAPDAQVIYEHFHRYLWAQPLVAGRRVLDLGSGEGFGAALLADVAGSVTGVDIDERAVEHSRTNYVAPNLDFLVAAATDLSAFDDGTFGAVVAFEMIEHVEEHERVLAEIARVLAPDGLLIMSTPERRAYSDERDFVNPYHARELTQDEFTALLGTRFSTLALFAQRAVTGSRIEVLTGPATDGHLALRLERAEGEWRLAAPPDALYLVALASNGELPAVARESSLFDHGLEVIAEHQATIEELLQELRDRREELLAAYARAERAEEAERQVKETVAWRLHERLHPIVYGTIGQQSALGRALRRVTLLLYRALGR
jgi:SAM-dependent methyltransferase